MNLYGFTPQEYKVIEELMKCVQEIYITACTDNLDIEHSNEDNDIFYSNKLTCNKLTKIAENNNIEISKLINLSKNYRFKSKELIHLEQNIYSNTNTKYTEKNRDLSVFLSANPYSEIEYVASKIVENVRDNGYRYNEIGIVTKNIDTYSGLIKAIFSKYNIPVYIDEKKDLGQNILIKYIISLLEVFSKNWSYESMIAYIKTKFCDIEDEEIYEIEKYARRWEIKYSKWYKEDWKYGESGEKLKYLNNIRKKVVEPLLSLRNKCYKNTTCKDLSKAIYEFLIENDIDRKLKEKANIVKEFNADLASEYEASFNTVIKILDEMVKVFGDENLSFEKYIAFLKISFSENGLGKIPAGFDEVTVGDVDRSRSHTVKVIFIIGLNDGSFPSVNNEEGFLSDTDREKLKGMEVELAKTTLEALYNDNFNIYKAFTTSEEKLYMSYVSSGSNRRCAKTINIIT